MRHGIPTCSEPVDPKAIYMRNMYCTFFWGPFSTEDEVSQAIATLDKADEYWDYDPFCMIYGSNPLPKDYVFGFSDVDQETRKRIEKKARP
jgi:hypothetical protein